MFLKIIAQNVSEEHGSTFGACSVLGNSEKYICKRGHVYFYIATSNNHTLLLPGNGYLLMQ
jgi:hypothetical protein